MDYHLTQHATDALAERQIRIAWMEQVLAAPDWTEPDAIDGNWSTGWAGLRISKTGSFVLLLTRRLHHSAS